jgi:isopentenyldiphosphate isomerase
MYNQSFHETNYIGYGVLVLPDHRILAIRRVVTGYGTFVPGLWSCSVFTRPLKGLEAAEKEIEKTIFKITGMSVPETKGKISNRHVFRTQGDNAFGKNVALYSYHIKQTVHMKVSREFEVKPLRFGALLTLLNDDDNKLSFTYNTELLFKQLQSARWRPNKW